jgi:type IV secretion system protein VirD4
MLPTDNLWLGWTAAKNKGIGFAATPSQSETPQPVWYEGPHLATVAPSGSGKCVSCAVPTCLTYPGQLVVLDVKGELYITTHRRRREMGQQVIKLDPFRLIDDNTDGLNPLDILSLPTAELETDCQTLAKLLSTGKGFVKDPFWELSANGLNSGVLGFIAACEPPEKRHLGRLLELIYNDDVPYGLAVLLDTKGKQMPRMAYQEIAAFLQQPERETRPSTLATAQSFLKGLNTTRVAESLLKSTFSLQGFRTGDPITIYLIIPPDRLSSHSAIISLWVGTLLKTIFSRTIIPRHRTLFLLDEAAALGHFPMLETAITLCRSYGVRVWTFWQDIQQIQSSFPIGWRTVLNNSAMQTFGVASQLMAQELAAVMDLNVSDLLALRADEQFLQLGAGKAQRCGKLNYLKDSVFKGLYDANRFYSGSSETIPTPRDTPRSGKGKSGEQETGRH